MSIKVVVHIGNATDWLTADATASYRLDRDTTAAFAAPTEVTTATLTTGVDRYEVWDASGVSTSWYRFRIEDDSDSPLSPWSTPFQVLAVEPIATLAGVKQRLGTGATSVDDDVLDDIIAGVNAEIVRRIGYYPGPSSDTTKTLHGFDAVRSGRRLWVPGGVRSVTSLTIADTTGGSGTAATGTDYVLGPSDRRPGQPYGYIEFVDVTTGAWSYFPAAYSNVVIVGLFGWSSVPDDLEHIATAWAVRRWKARASGDADALGSDEFGGAIISDRMPAEWRRIIDAYRIGTPMVA